MDIELYKNGVLTSYDIKKYRAVNNIKSYVPILDFSIVNIKNENKSAFVHGDVVKLVIDSNRVFEGKVDRVKENATVGLLDVTASGYGMALFKRNENTTYNEEEASYLLKLVAGRHLSEFSTSGIQETGNRSLISSEENDDGTVSVSTVGDAVAQKFVAGSDLNILLSKFDMSSVSSAEVDVFVCSDNSGSPDLDDKLKTITNKSLVVGLNEFQSTASDLVYGSDYWIVLQLKSGSFSVKSYGSGSSGRVKTYDGTSWSTSTADDLTYYAYSTSGKIIKYYKCVEKPLNVIFDDMSKEVDWVWFSDFDKVLYFQEEQFTDNGNTITELLKSNKGREGSRVINNVKVHGGNNEETGSESFKGNGEQKSFHLGLGAIKKDSETITGVSTSYEVNFETNSIVFDSAIADGTSFTVSYTYYVPVIAYAENPSSVSSDGSLTYVKVDSNIKTFSRAKEVADALLSEFEDPKEFHEVTTFINPDITAGETITLDDQINNISGKYVVAKVNHSLEGKARSSYSLINIDDTTEADVLASLKMQIEDIRIQTYDQSNKVTNLISLSDSVYVSDSDEEKQRSVGSSWIIGSATKTAIGNTSYHIGWQGGSWTVL